MPSFLTCATSSGIRLAPSSREYSLWVWRWTKGTSVRLRRAAPASLVELLLPATRRPAGRRAPAAAPGDDRGDRPPRTRDGRRPPHSPRPPPRPLPRPPSARPWRPRRPAAARCTSPAGRFAARGRDRGGQPAQQVPTGILPSDVVPCPLPPRRPAVEKQVRAPVWHAGPVCSTRYSTVSPSQSSRTSRRAGSWPDVSPFRQRRFPGSAEIVGQARWRGCVPGPPGWRSATIRTSPDRLSWVTTGTSPSAPNRPPTASCSRTPERSYRQVVRLSKALVVPYLDQFFTLPDPAAPGACPVTRHPR